MRKIAVDGEFLKAHVLRSFSRFLTHILGLPR